jgi:uncharacterized protein (TIGR00251 family)
MSSATEVFCRFDGADCLITLRLTPKSSRDALEGAESLSDGRLVLKARVRAVPEDGKANEALLKLLAKTIGCPRNQLSLESGATSRIKHVRVSKAPDDLPARLTVSK